MNIQSLIRPNVLAMKPYSSARDEFNGTEGIFLDANENPFGNLNRYPDPYQRKLKLVLSQLKGISTENIFIGNGSDEVIDLTYRIFCTPGSDSAISFPPTYGMYEVSANLNDVKMIQIPLNSDFQIDIPKLKPYLNSPDAAKLLFICSPNNPTGNNLNNLEIILEQFRGIVFVDEAYIDFSSAASAISLLGKYPNLIVSQTLSKAWGHAAIRVGIAYAGSEIISMINKVKPPYNVSALNQKAALEALQNTERFTLTLQTILEQKERLQIELSQLSFVKKIYPSDANFLLVETTNAQAIYGYLVERNIITRNRHSVVNQCIRISIGTPEENTQLINALKNAHI